MAGIYIHIPFCRQACNYCNFHFSTSLHYKEPLITSLGRELELQRDYLKGETIDTVYFGGGTPSLLETAECQYLIGRVKNLFQVNEQAEITLEANPDDINPEKLRAWKEIGINRFSVGIQSFLQEELRWMNRAHNADQAHACIEEIKEAGFSNFSIDLIYGSPLLSDKQWEQNVQTAISYNIPHLSCYALTVEEKTPLHKQIQQLAKQEVDADKQAAQFLLLMQWLRSAGYEHYEVSNFAKPGFRSRHNSSYWRGEKYLGIGPSAHSYNGTSRQWNIANNQQYIRSIEQTVIPAETEILSDNERLNEFIMISLRTKEGLDLKEVSKQWPSAVEAIEKGLYKFYNSGLVTKQDSVYRLTDEGMLMADGIAADLFQGEGG